MSIFFKKYDIDRDNLKIKFDYATKKYLIYKDNKVIPYEKLNKQSQQKYTEIKNEEMTKLKNRWNELKKLGYECDSFETYSEIPFTMTKEMEEKLIPLVEEEHVILGIHRVGEANEIMINDMLENGVLITGHGGNVSESGPVLERNFGIYADNRIILKEIANAKGYKNSNGSIVIRIPDKELTENIFVTDKNGMSRINPKYIIGYFPVNKEHCINKMIVAPKKISTNNYEYKYDGKQINYEEEIDKNYIK